MLLLVKLFKKISQKNENCQYETHAKNAEKKDTLYFGFFVFEGTSWNGQQYGLYTHTRIGIGNQAQPFQQMMQQMMIPNTMMNIDKAPKKTEWKNEL